MADQQVSIRHELVASFYAQDVADEHLCAAEHHLVPVTEHAHVHKAVLLVERLKLTVLVPVVDGGCGMRWP